MAGIHWQAGVSMSSKRSYVDSLNAGRQGEPYASLEELNRSLESMEQRLERNQAWPEPHGLANDPDPALQMPAPRTTPDPPYQWLDRPKSQESLAALYARLEQINDAVHDLPESLSLRSLEEKVRVLASAIEHLARHQNRQTLEAFAQIDVRLDEISRAIVASVVSAQTSHFDPRPFERVEARITALARQIEELVDERPDAKVIDRLNLLSQRLDEVAVRADERLTEQVAIISRKLDGAPSAQMPDQLLQDIDQRFNDIVRRLDDRTTDLASGETIRGFEARLEHFSERLDSTALHGIGIDPELIRNLEAQMSVLSAHLALPQPAAPEFDDIRPRLDQIERSIAGNRDSIFEAARQAADDAVRSFAGSNSDALAVAALADDLKALELLTRDADERNCRTFEAIHDTLLKIVDRLGSFETRVVESEQPHRPALDNAPSIEPEDTGLAAPEPLDAIVAPVLGGQAEPALRTPAEAAAAAAVAALSTDPTPETEPGGRVRSMLGGLSRAFGGRRENVEPAAVAAPAPMAEEAPSLEADLDEPLDAAFANRPLEPGSGAPDLGAIMRRVRDERSQPSKNGEPDAAKSDFIAAARRAAQAAAAEAEILKKNSDNQVSTGRFKLGLLFGAKRKTMLLSATAIIVALAGMQLGKAFMADEEDVAEQGASQFVSDAATAKAAVPAAQPAGDVATANKGEPAPANLGKPEPTQIENANAAPSASIATEAASQPETASPKPEIEGAATAKPNPAERSDAAQPLGDAPVSAASAAPILAEAGPVPLREAAEAGDAKAIFEIGARYADGRGVKTDLKKAAEWYEKSAELGLAPAQYRAGNFYEKGLGVARDVKKAKTWYQLAANQGNASAMHNLAVLFATGADGAPDNDAAARWFLQAAELGVADSQFNLGILSARGAGMPRDLEASYKWFAVAAMAGDGDAAAKRDEVAKTLRPEQLERALAAADSWKPKAMNAEANSVAIPEAWQESDDTTASIGTTNVLANIQRVLIRKGYDAGGADGVMGAKTQAAIAAFQGDNGMVATGEVDEKLVRTLLEKK
jgi:localization factor PodJL